MVFISKLKTFLTVIAIIILLLLLSFLICLKLAFTDDNTDKYFSTPDIQPAQTVAINALLGNQSDITEEQLNELVAYLIEQATEKELFNENCSLLAAYIDINTGKPSRCYFQVDYKDKKLGFSADIDIVLDHSSNEIKLGFSNAKVGRLKIPKSLIVTVLKKTNLQSASDYLSIDDLALNLPTKASIDVPVIGNAVTVEINELDIYEDTIHIETNPIIDDTLNNLKGILGNKIFDFAKDNIPESIGDYIEKFKEK